MSRKHFIKQPFPVRSYALALANVCELPQRDIDAVSQEALRALRRTGFTAQELYDRLEEVGRGLEPRHGIAHGVCEPSVFYQRPEAGGETWQCET